MQAEGTKRNLTVHSAQLSDTGTYTCRAGDNVLIFKVNIRGNKISFFFSKNTYIKSAQKKKKSLQLTLFVFKCEECTDIVFIISYFLPPKNLQ